MEFLGWKDILRPIRDGYRHLFPTPDTGPTPEERDRQRVLDQLKGFTYFDTFDQLENWTAAETDPIHIANTPLLNRPQVVEEAGKKANVLLCHDYSGNYHDYESAQGIGLDEERYSCEYLQFVDTFVYFSHKLACLPPPSWTNSLHRNGVKVLGTFLVEPQTKYTERLLHHNAADGIVTFSIAQKLAGIARHYGFDGWLVNIEKPFAKESWDPLVLEAFLRQLRDDLGVDKKVIWYDALTTNNRVSYQNSLTTLNLVFSKACGSVLTNYCWTESDALSSKQLALSNSMPPDCVYFGVDVWAQNATSLTHPRTTYGGGGTKTGHAVIKLAEIGLSVGVFAPAWSFEHFPGRGRALEKAMWDGTSLPDDIDCACGKASVQHPSNREFPITRSARDFPAGSSSFFYTDFSRAFGRHKNEQNHLWGGKALHSQVASQSLLPHMNNTSYSKMDIGCSINSLCMHLEDLPGFTQLVVETRSLIPLNPKLHQDTVINDTDNPKMYDRYLPLFNLNIATTEPLRLRIVFNFLLVDPTVCVVPAFYIKCSGVSGIKFFSIDRLGRNIIEATQMLQDERINEIGFHLHAPALSEEVERVVEITEICIAPLNSAPIACTIDSIRIEERSEGETRHKRLCWTYSRERTDEIANNGMPFSATTGTFSYFVVEINELELGRTYALEYILGEALWEKLGEGKTLEVKITGIGFDGRKITESWARVLI